MRPSLASRKRATAALIPSSEVPDIKPTTTPEDILSVSDWWRCIPGDTANHPTIFGEQFLGFLARYATLLHHDRQLHAFSSAVENVRRFISGDATHFHHDALTPIDQLVVGGAEIDHQVAVSLAESD